MPEEDAPNSHGLAGSGLPENNVIVAHAITARWTDVILDIPQDDQGFCPVHEPQEGPDAQLVDQELMQFRLNGDFLRKSVVMANVFHAPRMADEPMLRNGTAVPICAQSF